MRSIKVESDLWQVSRPFGINPTAKQLAFAVNPETFTVVVTSAGHPTLARYCDNFVGGGWLWLDTVKMTTYSGFFGHIPEKILSNVHAAVCNHFKKEFKLLK